MSGWFAHIDGLGAIMRYYRPETPSNPILGTIYGNHQKLKVVRECFCLSLRPEWDGVLIMVPVMLRVYASTRGNNRVAQGAH